MKHKQIVVIGSAGGHDHSADLAAQVGKAIADKGFILVTGACEGLPLAAATAAKHAGGMVVGVHPALNAKETFKGHYVDGVDEPVYDAVIYTGAHMKGRNVTLVRSGDAIVMVGGRVGTINEFTIAYDEGHLIGVLDGSGGASAMARQIEELGKAKNTGARVIYSSDPQELVDKLAELLR